MLKGKKILLGVCGSIAAYKSAVLIRLLIKAGAEVRVVMTDSATDFITPLTLATLSRNPVNHQFADDEGNWNSHIELGLWADVFLIAPASAGTIAKMANGLCDNLLTATYLSARCPVAVSPAMDLDMWHHRSTQRNIETLKTDGTHVVPVNSGELASGLIGEGRMAEPEELCRFLEKLLASLQKKTADLKGIKVLITAGPTVEAIDPVRYITNHSSGKMGFALAKAFADAGAEVTLVKGPTGLMREIPGVQPIEVDSAEAMYNAALEVFESVDVAIMAAAVADYTPMEAAPEKIKKNADQMVIHLKKTRDILATLGSRKKDGQLVVGFALETNNELEHAQAKLEKKQADIIVLNSLKDTGAGFGHDTNKISVIYRDGTVKDFGLKDKDSVAIDILNEIAELIK